MPTNQQWSTRKGVLLNLKAIEGRLGLDMNTLAKIEQLYTPRFPQIGKAAAMAQETAIILKNLVTDIRESI